SPITNLAAIGKLELLHQIYQQAIIPEAVFQELMAGGGQYPGAVVELLDWIHTRPVSNRGIVNALQMEVDAGEAEAIALAQELAADLLLMDEHIGRVIATQFGIRVIGLLGVLMEAKRRGLIREVKPLIDALMNL